MQLRQKKIHYKNIVQNSNKHCDGHTTTVDLLKNWVKPLGGEKPSQFQK